MTADNQNGHLPATPIEVEPTARQRAAHALAETLSESAGGIDWARAEASFRALAGAAGYESATVDAGRAAAARINEALLSGREPLAADLDAVRFALEQGKAAEPLELVDGTPAYYWQGWLVEDWLPRRCVAMLTGDGGAGKSRLAVQLAWALSGGGQWLGEAGQMPPPGADYGLGFEPLGPCPVVYATWEDSPEQIKGRLYQLARSGKDGNERNFKIADMRAKGHIWAHREHSPIPGITAAGEALRLVVERHEARLLVIDTLGVANGASEIDRAQVGRVLRGLGGLGGRERLHDAADSASAEDGGRGVFGFYGCAGRGARDAEHREREAGLQRRLQIGAQLQVRTGIRVPAGEREAELQQGEGCRVADKRERNLARKRGAKTLLWGALDTGRRG